MPTYDYACKACGHEFELFQQMSEPVKRKCPSCKKSQLQRLIGTGAGVIFKGGGFYETDYRSDSYTKAAEAEKKAASATSESGSGTDKGDKAAKQASEAKSAETPAKTKSDPKPASSTQRKTSRSKQQD